MTKAVVKNRGFFCLSFDRKEKKYFFAPYTDLGSTNILIFKEEKI